ncbi:MAG: hypothetical protein SNJ69_12060 [Chloroflexaceae bacterium]
MSARQVGLLGTVLFALVLFGIGLLVQGGIGHLSGAAAAPLAQPTVSATLIPRFISLDPYGAYLDGGATFSDGFGPNSGLRLPDGAVTSFSLGFTVPPDYAAGTTLTIRMVWHTPSTGCVITFRPNSIAIARPGRTHIIGAGASDGLSVVGGVNLNASPTANSSQETRIEITSPVSGTPLQPGDVIMFSMFRAGTAPADTCTGNLVIQGMALLYQGQTSYLPLVDD